MKKIIALLAGAFLCFGVAIAGERPALLDEKGIMPYDNLVRLAQSSISEAKEKLAECTEVVTKSEYFHAKVRYAVAVTALWHRENPDTPKSYADLYNHYREEFAKVGGEEPQDENEGNTDLFESEPYNLLFKPACGIEPQLSQIEEYYNLHKESTTEHVAHQMMTASSLLGKMDEYVRFGKIGGSVTARRLIGYYFGTGNDKAAGAAWYWELVVPGKLYVVVAQQLFPQILAYELGQDSFDAAALKSKLNRAILVYKAKARQWKPSKEGESNPYIEFVGMLQDTAKDL